MPFNFQSTLYGMEFLGLDGVHVALHRHAVPEQRLQFVKVRLQQRLKVLIQQNLLVQQQDAEVQIIHALTDGVHIHIGLRRLHLALKRCAGGGEEEVTLEPDFSEEDLFSLEVGRLGALPQVAREPDAF